MKKSFIKFLPLMAAVMLATSCSKDDDTNATQQPETKGIPFAIKVDMSQKLTKLGFNDNGTTVNISFTDEDVDHLKMQISSNEKTTNSGWGGPSKALYGELTLKSKDGVFMGTLDQIPYMGVAPEDGEELCAQIYIIPETQPIYESNESLEHLVANTMHQYTGTFIFDGSTPITNEEESGDPYYLPIPEFDNAHLPVVKLTDVMTYFEFNFTQLDKIYLWKSYLYTDENQQEVEFDNSAFYDEKILNNHKFWVAANKDQNFYRLIIRSSNEVNDATLLYSKMKDDLTPGVIFSVTRPSQN